MNRARATLLGAIAAIALAIGLGVPNQAAAETRYSVVGGCFALQSTASGDYVAKAAGTYNAKAGDLGSAEPFFFQATDLGMYLLYGPARDFLAQAGGSTTVAATPSPAAEWRLAKQGGAFTLTNRGSDLGLGSDGSGDLTVSGASPFNLVETTGCSKYPEVQINVKGKPSTSRPAYGEVAGFAEGHMHHMAFQFLGGEAHCGKPWDRYGAPYALVDCEDHTASSGCGAILETAVSSTGETCHDTVGWPSFNFWPHPKSLTHEQSYYGWLERAWRGGYRVFVNLAVENRVLCELYPLKRNECNEMESVLLQLRDARQLERYIDAQMGGPGKGFYRIVENPFEARKVISEGKMAVVLGMEVSEPFGCIIFNGEPQCSIADIEFWLDRLQGLGVSQLEIVNKFDNALTGVAGDSGPTGTLTNSGNFYSTGRFWDLEHCHDEANHDHEPTALPAPNDDTALGNAFKVLIPPGAVPAYPEGPLCNRMGLSNLGEHAIRSIAKRGMIFDPDHMSVYGRDQAMNLVESMRYPGVISSHSWSTENTLPRIYRLGGMITPRSIASSSYVKKWKEAREAFRGRQYFGVGTGADQNGLGSQGSPRGADAENPVVYPFKSFDGKQTINKQVSGQRTYDINVDGVAHYGLYLDYIEDLRMLAGDRIVRDLARGSEAYLQMWERARGVERVRCPTWDGDFNSGGLKRRLKLDEGPRATLYRAGQPVDRHRAWVWCTRNSKGGKRDVGGRRNIVGVFDDKANLGLIVSSLQRNQADGIGRGTRIRRLRGRADPIGAGLWLRRAGAGATYVYGVRAGKVRFTAIANDRVARGPAVLKRYIKRAGLN